MAQNLLEDRMPGVAEPAKASESWFRRWVARLLAQSDDAIEAAEGRIGDFEIPKESKPERTRGLINLLKARKDERIGTLIGGLAQTGMGLGLVSGYYPWLRGTLGRGSVSHGTQAENVASILGDGLSLAHAGKADRLNSHMMLNAAVDFVDNRLGGAFNADDFDKLQRHMSNLSSQPVSQRHYANAVIDYTQNLLKSKGADVNPEDIADFLTARGRRVYFGGSPHHVHEWGSAGSEAALAGKRLMQGGGDAQTAARSLKQILVSGADVMSGGTLSLGEEALHAVKFGRGVGAAPLATMTRKDALRWLTSQGDALKGKRAVMDVYTGALNDLSAFKDFPIVGHMVGSNKGIQRMISTFLPNYTPGRDMSVGHSVPPEAINRLYIMRGDDAVERVINISDAARRPAGQPAVSTLRKLRNAAVPAAASLIGAHLALRGITGKGFIGHGAALRDRIRGTTPEKPAVPDTMQKESAISPSVIRGLRGAGYGALVGAAMGVPTAITALLSGGAPEDLAGAAAGSNVSTLLNTGGNFGTLAMEINSPMGPRASAPLIPTMDFNMGTVGASMVNPYIGILSKHHTRLTGRDAFMTGGLLPESSDEWIRKNPWVGPASDAAAITTAGAGGGYALQRYYPSLGFKLQKAIQSMRDLFGAPPEAVNSPSAYVRFKAKYGPTIARVLPVLITLGATYAGIRGVKALSGLLRKSREEELEKARRQRAKLMGLEEEYARHKAEKEKR